MRTSPLPCWLVTLGVGLAGLAGGCSSSAGGSGPDANSAKPPLQAVSLGDSVPTVVKEGVTLEAARDEWTSFVIQLTAPPDFRGTAVRVRPPAVAGGGTIGASQFEVYQIVSMPVDVNRAAYVRHTGLDAAVRQLPRALLPLPARGGVIPLSNLYHPADPGRTTKPTAATVDLWVDVRVPAGAAAGDYAGAIEWVPAGAAADAKPLASVPVKLTVFDFLLPPERHLQMVGQLDWGALVRHYPKNFESVTANLMNRAEPKYAATIKRLDALMALAQHHRLGLTVPNLQPTGNWPALIGDAPPHLDWSNFESVAGPWLKGAAFADGMGLNYWPLPEWGNVETYELRSRLQYWSQAVSYFDQMGWLDKTAVNLSKTAPGRVSSFKAVELSDEAAHLLAAHRRLRVALPLEDDQVQLGSDADARPGVHPANVPRLLTAAPGLVSTAARGAWPDGVAEPPHWLRTDLPGLVPYVGAGGAEADVRGWAWLAFLRNARFVVWASPLPTLETPTKAADPNELIWFYPGEWFGRDEPVPTVQLKWLRRAQQDFEYLWLARERGQVIPALQMAQLLTKPVEIPPQQSPDPTYTLMTGTPDREMWADAQRLLARSILLHAPGRPADPQQQQALDLQLLQWARPQERPLLMGRAAEWSWDAAGGAGGNWLKLRLGLDVYNASAVTPEGSLRWTTLPAGWEMRRQPLDVPALSIYQIRRLALDARFDLTQTTPRARNPAGVELTIDGPDAKLVSPLQLVLPVAASDKHEGRLEINGKLDEWVTADLIQDGPLVQMFDRPDVQRQALERAETASKIYTGWSADWFYVAFAVGGVSPPAPGGRNDVDYQARRAWGEDLCEVLVQPVYADNATGPVMHVVCKPNGISWVERKRDEQLSADPWKPYESTGTRYAAQFAGGNWTGEVAIPWRVLTDDPAHGKPTLLRFNFAQHRTATGESASWAGPVDFGRDDAFTGVIYIRPG